MCHRVSDDLSRESSCYYNGTHFMEGSIVPTKEPCLMCKCTEKTLICALKVCPEQPIPPPRGCILVHKAGSCCPYLQCSKLNLAVKNNGDRKKLHFLDYYEKAAQERFENPNAYLRRSDDDEVEDNGACIVNGTVYKSGSAMVSSTLCSYCYCINGRQQCVKPKCALPSQKCAPVFVDSACCPIRYDCSGKTPIKNAELATTESANHVRRINNKHYQRMAERRGYRSNGCTAGGHTYPDGEKMKSEDPCEVCYCIRGQRKCTPKKCAPTIKGCTPRVPRGECCAVRYDCKHGEQKPFGRKMEDEEESFDFFSILFGPDPDAPKEEAKNVTEVIEAPVTEAAPVSTTSEKSFLDLLRAGLDFIDDAGEDELLLSTAAPSEANTLLTSTEVPPELQTVKVEIIQEPQAIYIEKPDFNFPVRKIPPVPIMFKPLPKIPTLLMNEPQFQNLESDSLLKENPTEVSNSLLETTIEKVTKVTEPIGTTTIATKRPNNKFVGFVPEKIPTTVFSRVTPAATMESTESTVLLNDPTTSVTTEGDITSTIEPDVTTTLRDTTTDRQSEEITTSTQRMGESEEATTVTSTVPSETSTMQEESSAEMSTEVTDTTIANSYTETTHEELRTEPFVVENNDTATTTETITSVAPTKQAPPPPTRPPNPLKENNLLSVLLSGLSNIFDATKNDSGKQSQKNRTEYRPITPKPIPISGFHKVSNIPSILESDIGMDYDEPTLPPSLPNLKIIPFLPADAVKKNDPPKPVSIVPPTYTYFKNHPNNYPIVNDPYEAPPSGYGVSNEHEILHPGMTYKAPGKPMTAEYEYAYDPAINYPALTESYDVDAKNGYYNTKVIRDKYDTVDEMDYDYDTDTIHKYAEHPAKQDLFQNELKKFIPTKYEVPQEGTYVPVYDKYGVGYPEKNVYYTNHKELAYGAGAKLDKVQVQSTDNPLFRIDGTDMSGFSPPTKTEGGFVPKEPIKDEFYYESYATTPFPTELTDDHHVKLPYNATPTSSYGVTPSNPFIDVIRTEPAPPLMSLIEDKEKLLSTLQSKNTSLEDLLGDPSEGSDEYEKQIISITTDANYLSSMVEEHVPTQRTTSSKPNFTGFELNFPVSVHHPEEPVSEATKPASPAEAQHSEPEPSGMFSLENMLNYLLREEDPINENRLRNTTNSETTGAVSDGVPPFKTLPSRLTAVYDPTVGLEASLGDVKPPSDEELHDGTVTLKVESAKNDTKTLYRPSLLDLPFLNPGFHTKPINQPESDPETQNELDRYGYGGTPEHHTDQYQVIAEGTPGANAQSYVVNPVDINKLKQHHSEGTAEITMKSKVKDTVGILKLAGCNIYGRMYRVGRIISELSGPCLECKCTEQYDCQVAQGSKHHDRFGRLRLHLGPIDDEPYEEATKRTTNVSCHTDAWLKVSFGKAVAYRVQHVANAQHQHGNEPVVAYTPAEAPTISDGSNTEAPKPPATMPAK
uniref:VWFC domain-containing protein n=1 Tax=Anopheles melas TaxID=34690 RepID=A0A182TST8_9DIPT